MSMLTATVLSLGNRALVAVIAIGLSACASRPINEQISEIDRSSGYRPNLLVPKRENNDPSTLFVLSGTNMWKRGPNMPPTRPDIPWKRRSRPW